MHRKRASKVRVEYITVFLYRPSIFPILTFDITLTTSAIVDAFKLCCNDDNANKILVEEKLVNNLIRNDFTSYNYQIKDCLPISIYIVFYF